MTIGAAMRVQGLDTILVAPAIGEQRGVRTGAANLMTEVTWRTCRGIASPHQDVMSRATLMGTKVGGMTIGTVVRPRSHIGISGGTNQGSAAKSVLMTQTAATGMDSSDQLPLMNDFSAGTADPMTGLTRIIPGKGAITLEMITVIG